MNGYLTLFKASQLVHISLCRYLSAGEAPVQLGRGRTSMDYNIKNLSTLYPVGDLLGGGDEEDLPLRGVARAGVEDRLREGLLLVHLGLGPAFALTLVKDRSQLPSAFACRRRAERRHADVVQILESASRRATVHLHGDDANTSASSDGATERVRRRCDEKVCTHLPYGEGVKRQCEEEA